MQREIVYIDEELCDGCGLCVPSCEEGALEIRDGKARLVEDRLCDGIGACIGHCPRGAIRVEHADAAPFSEDAVEERLQALGRTSKPEAASPPRPATSELRQWPVQLRLLSPLAPFLTGTRLLLAADCVPFAFPAFHTELLADRALAIACPKLDDPQGYVDKLVQMIRHSGITEIEVARMEVPCCMGLVHMALEARLVAEVDIPVTELVFGVGGDLLARREIPADACKAGDLPAPGG